VVGVERATGSQLSEAARVRAAVVRALRFPASSAATQASAQVQIAFWATHERRWLVVISVSVSRGRKSSVHVRAAACPGANEMSAVTRSNTPGTCRGVTPPTLPA
jgi:hypothetical protein